MPIEQKGIDVSRWQGDITWDKVRNAGVQFVMIRAASSTTLDSKFIRNIEGATAQGIPCGVYLYTYASTTAEALKEAEFLLRAIKPYKIQYPVAFDIEDITQHHLTNQQRTDLVETFCRRVAEEKYRPAVYSSLAWFNTMLDLPRLSAYDKWVAQWDVPKCSFNGPLQLWQNSSKGKIDGIQGDVDLNLCYFDYPGIGQKPSMTSGGVVAAPPNKNNLAAGIGVSLKDIPLFATASSNNSIGKFNGQYWIYDGVNINERMRLTNLKNRVGKKPIESNVTGYVQVDALKAALGKAKL